MNTTQFIQAVERHISAATYQPRFSVDDILAIASEEQRITVVPAIKSLAEDYFVVQSGQVATPGVPLIDIPTRVVGRNVRMASFSPDDGQTWRTIPRLSIDESSGATGTQQTGSPQFILFYDDQIRLIPTPDRAYQIRLWIEMRPSELVQTAYTATVNAAVAASATVPVETVPPGFLAGVLCDVTTAQGAHRIVSLDNAVVSSSVSQVVVTSALTAPIGSSVSLAGQTSLIQMPAEAVDCLVFATGLRMLEAQSIGEHADRMKALLDRAMNAMTLALKNRDINSLPKAKPSGLFRGGRSSTGFGQFRI